MHIAVSIPDMRHIVCAVGSFLFMISDISILFLYFYKNKSRKVHLFNLTTYYVGIFLLAISVIGIGSCGKCEEDLKSKQLVGVILGLIIMVILSLMDYSWISNFQWIMYGANIVLLLIVRLFGDSANGAARWIDFGFIRFQPTELSKIIIILFFARFFMDHEEDLNTFKTLANQ